MPAITDEVYACLTRRHQAIPTIKQAVLDRTGRPVSFSSVAQALARLVDGGKAEQQEGRYLGRRVQVYRRK